MRNHGIHVVWPAVVLALGWFVMVEGLHAQNVSFLARRDLDIGGPPSRIAVGDFNVDGISDLVVVTSFSNSVGILIGKGDGSFQPVVSYPVGGGPSAVAVGDFNGDGVMDIVTVNRSNLSLLLGKGDGTFLSSVNFSNISFATAVVTGDFNGDGKADLAVLTPLFPSGRVAVLLGNGDGTFQGPRDFSVGSSPFSITTGDFNRDGALDLAVANRDSNDVSLLLGRGDGTFESERRFPADASPRWIAAADFNGDGNMDLVVANFGSQDISVLLGRGDGTFSSTLNLVAGSSPSSLVVGDFNNDGVLDLAVTTGPSCCISTPGNVAIMVGNGDGTFQTVRNFALGGNGGALVTADFNGDGAMDVMVASFGPFSAGGIEELFGNGDGTFQVAPSVPAGNFPIAIAGADFNHDGNLDVAMLNSSSPASVTILLSNGDGTYQQGATIPTLINNAVAVLVGDFNGDGIPDLALAGRENFNNLVILLGKSDGTFRPPLTGSTGSSIGSIAVGDFNGDGKLDLVVASQSSGIVSVLLGDGDGTFEISRSFPAGFGPIAVGDFNGDGTLDLAIGIGGDSIAILLGNGDGNFQPGRSYFVGRAPAFIIAADLNGDGVLDLAVANRDSNNVSVLFGNGDGSFQSALNYATGINPTSIAVGDFNGDGRADLAVVNSATNNVSVLLNQGDQFFPHFARSGEFGVGNFPQMLLADDFNRDGKLDLVVVNRNSNSLSLLTNNTPTR